MPMTLGTTRRTAPETPDLAGKPTWTKKQKRNMLIFLKAPVFDQDKTPSQVSEAYESVAHMEGELSGEVVHPAGMHETQRVPNGVCAQHTLAGDWTNASVGQRGRHDAARLTRHLDGAQLPWKEFRC